MDRSLSAGDGARSGAKWLGLSRAFMQVGQFAFSIVNARLLLPEQFGIAAVAISLIGLAEVFTDIGLAAAIVQAKVATRRILNTAFWLNFAAGIGIALIVALAAAPAAAFYDQPELLPLLLYVAVGFGFTRGSVQTAILERTYQYKRLAIIETSAFVIGAVTTPVLALSGVGAAALVIGALTQIVLRSLFLWVAVPWKPTMRPDRAEAARLWRYSRGLVGFNVLNFWASRNIDTLVLGKTVSTRDLGEYTRAYNLMMVPVKQTSLVLGRILFPSLSRLAHAPARVADAWIRGTSAAAMLTMPLATTMAVTAPAAVLVLYGEPWRGMASDLTLLSLSAIPQTLSASSGAVYRAIDRTGQLFRAGVGTTILTITCILGGVHWGTTGVAAALVVNGWLGLAVMWGPLLKALDMRLADLRPLLPAVLVSAGVGVAELAIRLALPDDLAPFWVLTAQALAGLGAFFFVAARLGHPLVGMITKRVGRGKRRADDPTPAPAGDQAPVPVAAMTADPAVSSVMATAETELAPDQALPAPPAAPQVQTARVLEPTGPAPLVSVIVPTHNDAEGLRLTLDALARVDEPIGGFEVLVCDDRSTVDLGPLLEGRPNVRYIPNDGSPGSYGARNTGVRNSRGYVLAFTDADCEPVPGWLTSIVAALDEDPTIVVAGAIHMPLPRKPTLAAMVDVTCHLDQERVVTTMGYAVTANVACMRETFERVGAFAEQVRSSGDREWTSRAQRNGAMLRYVPGAGVSHPPRATGGELWRKSKRVGLGSSAVRHETDRGQRERPSYLHASWVKPRHRARGLQRVRENGGRPGRLRWLAAGAAQLAFVQYPQVLFAARADLARALRPGKRR